jgi:hypothetical protein
VKVADVDEAVVGAPRSTADPSLERLVPSATGHRSGSLP